MAARLRFEIGIEHCADRTDHQPARFGDGDTAALALYKTIGGERLQPIEVGRERAHVPAMAATDIEKVDPEVAHQATDDLGAEAIVGGQLDAARYRQRALIDRCTPREFLGHVLDVALRQGADGRGAQTQQRCGRIGCVALEVAP